jgi:Flp pilus assembly protein TadD
VSTFAAYPAFSMLSRAVPRMWFTAYLFLFLSNLLLAQAANPDLASRLNREGMALLDQGRLKEAVDRFRQAIQSDPHNISAHNNLGVTLRRQGDFSGALSVFHAARKGSI